jgi:hypothetical protein
MLGAFVEGVGRWTPIRPIYSPAGAVYFYRCEEAVGRGLQFVAMISAVSISFIETGASLEAV